MAEPGYILSHTSKAKSGFLPKLFPQSKVGTECMFGGVDTPAVKKSDELQSCSGFLMELEGDSVINYFEDHHLGQEMRGWEFRGVEGIE